MDLAGLIECIPNVSEGRDVATIERLASACGPTLLDVHSDPDHHRSVFTLGGPEADVTAAIRSLAGACVEGLDLTTHQGVHPRFGALDVVPFTSLDGTRERAVECARSFAQWLSTTLDVPTFLYGDAALNGDAARAPRSLPELRRTAFALSGDGAEPDFGPGRPHPTAGATAVGTRPVLVAVNCDLEGADLDLARAVASAVRERDGGLPGVRALAFPLAGPGRVQVSMNLVDVETTGIEAACEAVRRPVEAAGSRIARLEVVGLIPRVALEQCTPGFRRWAGIDDSVTIEARLAAHGF